MFLRVARHTDNIEKIANFYINVLGFELLGNFEKHKDYDGVFLGMPQSDWHFEFTQSKVKANHTFDEDDVIVLYPKSIIDYNELIDRIERNNISILTATNPFWNENGKMFLDPDGYRIVISPLKAVIDQIN